MAIEEKTGGEEAAAPPPGQGWKGALGRLRGGRAAPPAPLRADQAADPAPAHAAGTPPGALLKRPVEAQADRRELPCGPAGEQPETTEEVLLDAGLLLEVRGRAVREGRQTQEVLNEMLAFALEYHQKAERNLQRWLDLTPREQQITALACQHYTFSQIAARLTISYETVKSTFYRAAHKLDCHSRLDLLRTLEGWDFSAWVENEDSRRWPI